MNVPNEGVALGSGKAVASVGHIGRGTEAINAAVVRLEANCERLTKICDKTFGRTLPPPSSETTPVPREPETAFELMDARLRALQNAVDRLDGEITRLDDL